MELKETLDQDIYCLFIYLLISYGVESLRRIKRKIGHFVLS